MSYQFRWTLLVLSLLGLQGCRQGSPGTKILTEGNDAGEVDLMVTAVPNPEGGLMITATATNNGSDTQRYTATCGRADMEFRFHDASGNELKVTNPCEPRPLMGCPTALGVELEPGASTSAQHWWSGQLWGGCTGTPAPAGDYRVTVVFSFYEDIEVGEESVEATGTFHWQP